MQINKINVNTFRVFTHLFRSSCPSIPGGSDNSSRVRGLSNSWSGSDYIDSVFLLDPCIRRDLNNKNICRKIVLIELQLM